MSAPLETNAPSFGARFDKMAAQLDYLVARQQAVDELLEELAPIARLAMTGAVETLDELDKAGWFAMARCSCPRQTDHAACLSSLVWRNSAGERMPRALWG